MENEHFGHPFMTELIGSAIEVHRQLGPGLLENTYEHCLAHELESKGIPFARQAIMPVSYKGEQLDCGYRLDLFVGNLIIVELKTVEDLCSLHHAQLLTYMKLARAPFGLLMNFNVKLLKNGIRKFVLNEYLT